MLKNLRDDFYLPGQGGLGDTPPGREDLGRRYLVGAGRQGVGENTSLSTTGVREGKTGEQVVGQVRGKYAEAVSRGNVYSAQTAATGVAPGTALGTTAAFCLYNPVGSGKNLVVNKVAMGLISGTLGAGTVWLLSSSSTDAVPSGTAITPRNRLCGGANNSVAQPLTTATVTSTAAKMIGVLCSLNEGVVATTAINNEVIAQDVDGEVIVPPGNSMMIHATAAGGSSPLVVFSVTWEEVTVS